MAKVNLDVDANVNGIERLDQLGAKVASVKRQTNALAGGLEKLTGALGDGHAAAKGLKDGLGVLNAVLSASGGAVGVLVAVVGSAILAFKNLWETFSKLYKDDGGAKYFDNLAKGIDKTDEKITKLIEKLKQEIELEKSRAELSGGDEAEVLESGAEGLQEAINQIDKSILELKTANEANSKELIAGRISSENFQSARQKIAEEEAKLVELRNKTEIELNGTLVKMREIEEKRAEEEEKRAAEAEKKAEEQRKEDERRAAEAEKKAEEQKKAEEERLAKEESLINKLTDALNAGGTPEEQKAQIDELIQKIEAGAVSIDSAKLEFASIRGDIVAAGADVANAERENADAAKNLEDATRKHEEAQRDYQSKQKELLGNMAGQLQTAMAENASKLSNDFGTGIRSATDSARADRYAVNGKTIHALERQLSQQQKIAGDTSRSAIERERANAKIAEIRRIADEKIGKGVLDSLEHAKKNGTTPSERAKARKDAIKEAQEAQAKAIQEARQKMQVQLRQKADAEAAAKATADNLYNLMKKYFKGAQIEKPKSGIV